jgi:hypothetical protein
MDPVESGEIDGICGHSNSETAMRAMRQDAARDGGISHETLSNPSLGRECEMSTRFRPLHHEIAKRGVRSVLIKWVMDHRYNPDPNDRFSIEMMGCTTPEKAKRIWAILQEPEPKEQP